MNLDEYRSLLRTVETGFGEFSYLEAGEGPPALFVHGVFVSSYLWRDVIDAVRDERRCIAYNLPGHGGSRVQPDQDLSLPAQAEMLEAFCDSLGLDSVDLVANDTGGAIAQAFAVRCPSRVRTLTLTNCEARDVLPSPEPLAAFAAELAEKGELHPLMLKVASELEAAQGDLGFAQTLEQADSLTSEDVAGYVEPHSETKENAREVERFLTSLDAEQLAALEPGLRRLEAPTLVVWGTGDPFFKLELAYWLRHAIPGCGAVVEVDGGKLFWPGERGDELVPHLRRHWAAALAEQPAA